MSQHSQFFGLHGIIPQTWSKSSSNITERNNLSSHVHSHTLCRKLSRMLFSHATRRMLYGQHTAPLQTWEWISIITYGIS